MSNGINTLPLLGEAQSQKRELGQFLTPAPIADFMASFFSTPKSEWRILDAGAGAGALASALARKLCTATRPPDSIRITAYEIDPSMVPLLRRAYAQLQRDCQSVGTAFSATILNTDFIECATEAISRGLFSSDTDRFNAAILNPPYRKINSGSRARKLLRIAGIETSNLYTAFLALASQLLSKSGELVAITPRSFCNGPYFRPFRRLFLESMRLQRIHVFDSRSAAFSRDAVLQENVIIHAIRSKNVPRQLIVSSSSGTPGAPVRFRKCKYCEVVSPNDPNAFIHLVTDDNELSIRHQITGLSTSLPDLMLTVSTGRVVDFRASEFLRMRRGADTAPLLRPCHFNGPVIEWPRSNERKPCAISVVDRTRRLLVPRGYYVLVKRFSAKEEKRRIVACVYDPTRIQSESVGIENHLNYFHANGKGIDKNVAKGLAAYLNSTFVDQYFRHFSGHTQVNATDLRSIPYPDRTTLESLGAKLSDQYITQLDLDELVRSEVF